MPWPPEKLMHSTWPPACITRSAIAWLVKPPKITECAAPIGAHANIAKLAAMTYGQALNSLDLPVGSDQDRHGQHE